ncbi:MAG: hypothetical protein ACJ8AT_37545 [Hyalangium sp.]|uniref:hypothetical protein n=1 Tax=Hyalangium sp. TaxID=2028555 RepID=UPI00389A1F3C
MRKTFQFALAMLLSGCMRGTCPPQAPLEDDRSIAFPQFFEHEAVAVGLPGQTYDLDGEMLRALTIATNDFLPSGNANIPCRNRQEAQSYRAIRQGNVIFVYIYEKPSYCGSHYPAADSGVKYAISTDGRILRRVIDGQPMGSPAPTLLDGGTTEFSGVPGSSPTFDAIWNTPNPALPSAGQDGGFPPSNMKPPASPSSLDGGFL